MDTRRIGVVLGLLAGLACACQAQSQPDAGAIVIRKEVRLINVYVTVKDHKGQLIPNMTEANFSLLDDKKPQDIVHFAREDEIPLLLMFLVDSSTSQSKILHQEQGVAARFLGRILHPGDQAAVFSFDSNAYVIQGPTSEIPLLERALKSIEPFSPGFALKLAQSKMPSGTRMCDALAWASEFQPPRSDSRKVILLVSDGVDSDLDSRLRPALETSLRHDVMIYSIHMVDPNAYGFGNRQVAEGERAMRRLAHDTGGRFFPASNLQQVEAALNEVSIEVRAQYSLSFMPRYLTYTGRMHPITVNVNQKDMVVRARRGYFSPSQ